MPHLLIYRSYIKKQNACVLSARSRRWTTSNIKASKEADSDESYSDDDQSSTSGSEINDEYVLETSCNLAVNRNEKQVSQNLFFSRK